MAPSTKRTFPPVMTASKWDTIWGSCFAAALSAHGKAHAADGTLVPPLTNGEAVALTMAWRHAAALNGSAFPLWSQFAAHAYGWTVDNGTMDVTDAQRAKAYNVQLAKELWLTLQNLAYTLDAETPSGGARLVFSDHFEDATVQGAIAADLASDGVAVRFKLKGGTMAPAPKPKPKPTQPAWVTIAWLYFGYRVLKNLTGGTSYQG